MKLAILANIGLAAFLPLARAAGFRTVGSSGCAAQMAFLPPRTSSVVFIDNYHVNYGQSGVNLQTGAPSSTSYVYNDGSGLSVFGTEYDLNTNTLRPLRPLSNTFCSAGSFFADGTLANVAGAEAGPAGVAEGFNKIRTYAPGACSGACNQDWVEETTTLQQLHWYPGSQTLVDGSVLVVGGSNAGGLVLNEANINVPTYEIVYHDGRTPSPPVTLPILQFTAAENLVPGLSYNLYPMLHLLPNINVTNQIFTVAGNQTIIWDYGANSLIRNLPNTPLQPRTFPSSATSVLLPLVAPDYTPTVLICGGSSGDIPDPVALSDCYTINPLDSVPTWTATDNLPNGPQTMSDGILLPDGTVLIINGARKGCGGGFMADTPVLQPVIYNCSAPAGQRFTTMPATTIPRLYHSVAILLASGEVLVAGSNPAVSYSASGTVPSSWPLFDNNGHQCALHQQQSRASTYTTEYRVEIFSPPYMSAAARPNITSLTQAIAYNITFTMRATLPSLVAANNSNTNSTNNSTNNSTSGNNGSFADPGTVQVVLSSPGFHTHGQAMSQRMVMMEVRVRVRDQDGSVGDANETLLNVVSPRDKSVMPPGVYLVFVVEQGIPSVGEWVQLG